MTREETKEAIKVMQAFVDGKEIEQKTYYEGKYGFNDNPRWDWENDPQYYRVNPEPHYRPFKSAEEMMDAIREHGSWVRLGKSDTYQHIVTFSDSLIRLGKTVVSYKIAFDGYVFADGTPFGKLVADE